MNVLHSPAFRNKLDLLGRAALLFALGVATGQAGQTQTESETQIQSRTQAAAPQLRPLAADLPTVRHSELQLNQRQRWVF
jgi:hypothetical protein